MKNIYKGNRTKRRAIILIILKLPDMQICQQQ